MNELGLNNDSQIKINNKIKEEIAKNSRIIKETQDIIEKMNKSLNTIPK